MLTPSNTFHSIDTIATLIIYPVAMAMENMSSYIINSQDNGQIFCAIDLSFHLIPVSHYPFPSYWCI